MSDRLATPGAGGSHLPHDTTRRGAVAAGGALTLALAACVQLPRAPAPAASVAHASGRMALRVDAQGAQPVRSLSAAFDLLGDGRAGELRLSAPWGIELARARWQPGQASLHTPTSTQHFNSLEDLSARMLGEPLPLQALAHWLHGQPWPEAAHRPLAAPSRGFEQMGWQVLREADAPLRLVMRRETAPAVVLRAILD